MVLQKLIGVSDKLENPNYPLLGPNLKGLYMFGIWQYGSKFRNILFNMIHISSLLFVGTEFVEMYQSRNNMLELLETVSVTGVSFVAICKTIFFISMLSKWTRIVDLIRIKEISQMRNNDPNTLKVMKAYTKYSRLVTYMYWILLILTCSVTVLSPAVKYIFASEYRQGVKNGTEPYPHIFRSWVPFNKDKVPGYIVVTITHVWMTCQGAGIIAVYDANIVAVMSFLKGQAIIIKGKCRRMFGENEAICDNEIMNRIKDIHRHHTFLLDVFNRVNFVLSPVMFIYFLVCSITICCGVVQFTTDTPGKNVVVEPQWVGCGYCEISLSLKSMKLMKKGVNLSHKFWVIELVTAQVFQLFLYCWHSNEVALETAAITQGIFESKYWRSDLKQRKLLVLLIGKMEQPFVLKAGPFTDLSIPTFMDVIRGTYSFYALVTQMQDNE